MEALYLELRWITILLCMAHLLNLLNKIFSLTSTYSVTEEFVEERGQSQARTKGISRVARRRILAWRIPTLFTTLQSLKIIKIPAVKLSVLST
jgi:hypothetical protein